MHDADWRQWVALEQVVEPIPREVRSLRASTQPLAPGTFHLMPEAVEGPTVASDAVIREVPLELAHERLVLVLDRQMAAGPAPLRDPLHCSRKAALGRLARDHPAPLTGDLPDASDGKNLVYLTLASYWVAPQTRQ